jgi:hypothetical protein
MMTTSLAKPNIELLIIIRRALNWLISYSSCIVSVGKVRSLQVGFKHEKYQQLLKYLMFVCSVANCSNSQNTRHTILW